MNKLSFQTVEKLFLQTNPTGDIWQTTASNKGHYAVSVAFKTEGKVYEYKVKNYVQLVEKLKLDIKLIYKKDYDNYLKIIKDYTEKLELGYYIDNTGFFSDTDEKIEYSENEINIMRGEIKALENKIEGATLV